jgi:hypothetical protein
MESIPLSGLPHHGSDWNLGLRFWKRFAGERDEMEKVTRVSKYSPGILGIEKSETEEAGLKLDASNNEKMEDFI